MSEKFTWIHCGLNTDGKFTLSVIPFINLLVIPAQLLQISHTIKRMKGFFLGLSFHNTFCPFLQRKTSKNNLQRSNAAM